MASDAIPFVILKAKATMNMYFQGASSLGSAIGYPQSRKESPAPAVRASESLGAFEIRDRRNCKSARCAITSLRKSEKETQATTDTLRDIRVHLMRHDETLVCR